MDYLHKLKETAKARVMRSVANGKDRLEASGHSYLGHAWLSFQTACVLAATSAEVLLHGFLPQLGTDDMALQHLENVAVPMLEELAPASSSPTSDVESDEAVESDVEHVAAPTEQEQ